MNPTFAKIGDGYRFEWSEDAITIDLERLRERDGELKAGIVIRSQRMPNPGLLHDASLNLGSSSTQRTLSKVLEEREPALDWYVKITQVANLAKERWREGEPLVDLGTVDYRERPRWLLEPFLSYGGPTVIFADGGSGKSIFALALARSVACGRPIVTKKASAERAAVLYLDWETDASTHSERMAAICAGQGCGQCDDPCPIYYRREVASLYESAQGLRRKIDELGVGLVVVDSLGAARGGDPNSAEITILTFNAMRSFGVPVLIIDHVTKAAGSDSTKPYGSVYSYNLARLTWSITKAQEAGERRSTIALTNWKSNNGRLLPRLGYDLHFITDDDSGELMQVGFTPRDVRDDPVLSRALPLKDQIAGVIRSNKGEAMAPSMIADALVSEGVETSTDSVRTILNRYKDHLFVNVAPGRWGLLAHV